MLLRTVWPYGRRGEYPHKFNGLTHAERMKAVKIPGTTFDGPRGVKATLPAARAVARILGRTPPEVPDYRDFGPSFFPGYDEYRRKFKPLLDNFPYQPKVARWQALHAYALNALPMRGGKTPVTLAAITLNGPGRSLIVSPAGPRLGWAEEIKKWCGEDQKVLLLYGRAQNKAWWFGDRSKSGNKRYIHGRDDCHQAIEDAQWVIVNYELLAGEVARDDQGGVIGLNPDLEGWVSSLSTHEFTYLTLDESRNVANWDRDDDNRGYTRRERIAELAGVNTIPVVYLLDGTPMRNGRVKSYWGQFDIMSGGLVGYQRKPYQFERRWCGGEKQTFTAGYGDNQKEITRWYADGVSRPNEFKKYKKIFVFRKSFEELGVDLPPIRRPVKRLEHSGLPTLPKTGTYKSKMAKLLAGCVDIMMPAVLDEVYEEMEQGCKGIIFTRQRATAKAYFRAIEKRINGKRTGSHFRSANAKVWLCIGNDANDPEKDTKGLTPEQRHAMCASFRQHHGAAWVVATGTSLGQGGYKMANEAAGHPVLSLHWVEQVSDPVMRDQAEKRVRGLHVREPLTIVDWAVEGSITDSMLRQLRPKYEALVAIENDEQAQALLIAQEEKVDEQALIEGLLAAMERSREDDEC